MHADLTIDALAAVVARSKKYRSLYAPTIRRAAAYCLRRAASPDPERCIKNRLRVLWGGVLGIASLFPKARRPPPRMPCLGRFPRRLHYAPSPSSVDVRTRFFAGDILTDAIPHADVTLLLKLLPLLERDEAGSAREVVCRLPCRFAVVSFPASGLSDKKRGMKEFYAQWFRELIAPLGLNSKSIAFLNELIFIVEKKPTP